MKRNLIAVMTLVLVTSLTQQASASIYGCSDFDADEDGWIFDPVPVSWRPTGGNPDGYLHYDNNRGGQAGLSAPEKFLGDWSGLQGAGIIEYDVKIFSTGSVDRINYYALWIYGPGGSAKWTEWDLRPSPSHGWLTLTARIIEADWVMISGTWDALIGEVSDFRVGTAFYRNWGPFEITGIDNVCITPEPATLSLLALGSLVALRRRRR